MSVAENYSRVIADLLASNPDAAIALWDVVTRNDDVPFVMDVHARLSALGSLDPLADSQAPRVVELCRRVPLSGQRPLDLHGPLAP